eukprot:Gregarina_sp_Pseudo_9__1651@NODE_210_length_3605_cov_331_563376_g195_i0_p1_GENE_NODE_210_length_3605_cov_331_563376_g195_i0NODE_210_length_3605_cov_331_563376_g195_i0_p1_ORF_typecomplete_len343_score68_43Aldo_ket_red/PF00248_21/6_7e53_NODE_210_length_3605_cov_331_563376_g195_i01171145
MKLLCAKLHNGVLFPAVGFGTWELPESADTEAAIKAALDAGYRHVDTASVYGNQNSVGRAVSAFEAQDKTEASSRRDDIRIAGKFIVVEEAEFRGNFRVPHAEANIEKRKVFVTGKVSTDELSRGEAGIVESFEKHLKSLNRECADLILLHFPAPSKAAHDDETLPQQRIDAWKVMERLYKAQKCRAIGVSNYMFHHLKPLVEDIRKRRYTGDLNATLPMVNQFEFSPYCLCTPELVTLCESEGIILQSYSTLGSAKGRGKLLAEKVITDLAASKKVSPSSVVLRWALEKNFVVVPRSRNPDHIKDNLQCLFLELSKENEVEITELGVKNPQRFCWDPTNVN